MEGSAGMRGRAKPAAELDPLVGSLLHGKYRILRSIGEGGFGAVYEAVDERGAGNRVAIKVLRGELAGNEALVRAFREEARRVTRLGHPNVVDWKVFDEDEQGTRYFVMELVEGEELDRVLGREGPLEPARVARLLLQMLDALRAAHHLSETESILHLDLKPRNVFLVPAKGSRPEQVKVIDFGIGQYVGEEPDGGQGDLVAAQQTLLGSHQSAPLAGLNPSTLRFARVEESEPNTDRDFRRCTGCTPEYASPEQCAHVLGLADIRPLDGRSDVYSLGVMAFQMLTGELPFARPLAREDYLHIHRQRPARRVARMGAKVPRRLARFVERCLAKDPERRFRDTHEAWRAMQRIVHPPVAARAALVGGPLLALALAGGALLRGGGEPPSAPLRVEGRPLSAQSPLYLGPARPTARLELPAEARPVQAARLQLLRVPDGEPLGGFEVVLEDGELALVARSRPPGRIEQRVRVAAPGLGVRLEEFVLVWLGEGAWELEQVALGGTPLAELGGRAVDPSGLALEVWVAGDAKGELAGVGAARAGGPSLALAHDFDQGPRRRFRAPLDRLDLAPGAQEIELVLRDPAGREERRRWSLDVVPEALAPPRVRLLDRSFTGAEVECLRSGLDHRLTPRTRPELVVELVRPAELVWRIESAELEGAPSGRSPAALRHGIPLGDLAGERSYRAAFHWEVDDGASVLRGEGSRRGARDGVLQLAFEAATAEVEARLGSGLGARALVEDEPVYLREREAPLWVARATPVPMRVEVRLEREGAKGGAPALVCDDLRSLSTHECRLDLRFPDDGAYALVVATHPFDSAAEFPTLQPESVRRFRLVVDGLPPRLLGLEGLAPGTVVLSLDGLPASLTARVDAGGPHSSPARVDWELRATAGGGALAQGSAPVPAGGAGLVELDLGALRSLGEGLPDGEHRLMVHTRDAAGNGAEPEGLALTVALRGPELRPEAPRPGTVWQPSSAGRWTVQVRAEDPNGVRGVRARLAAQGDGPAPLELVLAPQGTSSTWSAEVELPHEWSRRTLTISLAALDGAGQGSERTLADVRLPEIREARPAVLVDAAGHRMRWVGPNGGPYLFGGEGDHFENQRAREADLPDFNPRAHVQSRSWQIRYGPGEIEGFYLDEYEVSVGEYADFLADPRGWAASTWWPPGSERPGDPGRREELLGLLQAADAELPVSGVTWEEAQAFAAWAGKRLPSFVEWEFAARGTEYRILAAGGAGARINAGRVLGGPWPRGEGADLTPDTLLRDLSGNVAEWTASPADGQRGRPGDAHRELLRDPDAWRTGGPYRAFWAAGAGFDSRRVDFSEAVERERTWSGPQVGFRCALSLGQAREALRAGRLRAEDRP